MKAIITIGIPGSGKSYKYRNFKGVVVNRDDARELLFEAPYKPSRAKEKEVTEYTYRIIKKNAETARRSIAITDTGLNPGYREALSTFLKELGYVVEFDVIHCAYEKAVKQDLQRSRSVGADVIWKFYKKYHQQFGIQPYKPSQTRTAYIFDIDGTLAIMKDRSPFEWDKVGNDLYNTPVWNIISLIHTDIIIMSGRDEVCREETTKWLREGGLKDFELYMRPEGSQEKDFEVKHKLFNDHINGRTVLGVFDDRPQVCRLWNLLELPLFKVGDQGEF